MNVKEFAAETHIAVSELRAHDDMPDDGVSRAVVQYFENRNDAREKRIIKEWLLNAEGKYHIEDGEILAALYDYLSYRSHTRKYAYQGGLRRLRYECYRAHRVLYHGKEQAIRAMRIFFSKASLLGGLHSAVIVLNAGKAETYGLLEPFHTLLGQCHFPCVISNTDQMPSDYHWQRILIGILPNHFSLEIMETADSNELTAAFTSDAVAVNGEYLRYRSAIPVLGGGSGSATLCHFRIAYILDLMKISNQEISNILYIDKTLVSKWKNGRRRLHCYDEILHKLASMLYHGGEENRRVIRSIVSAYDPLGAAYDDPDVLAFFRKWLTYQNESDNRGLGAKTDTIVETWYLTYIGSQGLRDAVKTLLHYVGQTGRPVRLYITCFKAVEWLYYLDGIIWRYLTGRPQIELELAIDTDFSVSEMTAYLLRNTENGLFGKWIADLLVSGKLTLRFFHSSKPYEKKIICAVPGVAALDISRESGVPEEIFVRGYYDPFSADQLLPAARLPPEGEKAWGGAPSEEAEILVINDIGILGLLEKKDLTDCFQLSPHAAEWIYRQYPSVFLQKEKKVRFILSAQAVTEAVKSGTISYQPLSFLFQKEIHLSASITKYYIKKAMLLLMQARNYDIQILTEKGAGALGRCIIDEKELVLWNESGIRVFHDGHMMKMIQRIAGELTSPLLEKNNTREHNLSLLARYLRL